jgi:hypothetical protein
MPRHKTAEHNHYMKTANESFETVAKLKCLETPIASQNYVHEEIKSGLH